MLACERVMCCALCACLPSFQSTGGEVYRDFEFAFDAAQRKEFWTLYGAVGVPFTAAFAAVVVMVLVARHRLDRFMRWVLALGKRWDGGGGDGSGCVWGVMGGGGCRRYGVVGIGCRHSLHRVGRVQRAAPPLQPHPLCGHLTRA